MSTPHSGPTPTGNPKADAKAAKAYAKASRNWYQKKRWWAAGVLALMIIVGGMGGSGETTDTTEAVASEPTAQEAPATEEPAVAEEEPEPTKEAEPKPAPEPKAVKVEAKQMLKEFEGNEAAADAKYKGKVVQVTGVVDKVDTEVWDDEQYVVQINGGGDWDFLTVNCNDVTADVAAKVVPDSKVTVRGTFDDGGDLGVEVKDCTVL